MEVTAHDTGALDEPRLRELIDVSRSLVAELDPEVVLGRVLEAACELTGARSAALGVLDSDRHELERVITQGIDEAPGQEINFLKVPILIRGRAWGNLYLTGKVGGGEFDEADEQSAAILAEWAAVAVDNAQSVAEDRMRNNIEAAERERGRWARELHDEALQSMAGLRVLLSAARRGRSGNDNDQLLFQAIERVDHTIAEMRRLIADLRPPTLDELGLSAALEALVERLTWGEVLDAELRIDLAYHAGRRPTRLLSQIENTVYRLVQEGLNNAARHGGTDRAVVEVIEAGESVRVRIEDEGRGFDPVEETDGFGLLGMRERVVLAGGTLEVKSAPGEGTSIVAVLPARHRREGPGAATTPGSDEAGNRAAESR